MVTAPHIASPGPAAEPCYVYTGGSSVAWVSWLVRAVCKRRTASRRLSGYVGPRSRQSSGALCGGHATVVEHTLPASEGKGLNLELPVLTSRTPGRGRKREKRLRRMRLSNPARTQVMHRLAT